MHSNTASLLRKTVLAGAIGNVLEWYDFALYGYFAPVFATLFFPSADPSLSLIAAFGVFAIGFLARPLGALLFGYWGDTRGRREALAWSIILMAFPTCLVGLLPTYAQIGLAAPITLTVLRFLQGLSVGGEFTGSVTFLVEHAAPAERGYVGSWAGFSAQIGALLGSGVGTLAAASLSQDTLELWGWRVPFVAGSLIAAVGWYLRRHIPESPVFERLRRSGAVSSSPAQDILASYRVPMAQVIVLVLLHSVGFYVLYVYLPTYLTTVTTLPMGTVLTINTISMALLALLIPLMGGLSDRVGQLLLLRIGAAGLALTAIPLFTWFASGRFWFIVIAQIFLTVLLASYVGPFFATVATLFPASQRYTGLSVSYNIASALFGGTAPLVATIAMEWSGNSLAPGWYVSLCAFLSLIAVFTIHQEPHEPTEDQPRHRS